MKVEIDEARIDAELDQVLAELGPDGLEGDLLDSKASWKDLLCNKAGLDKAHQAFAPSWDIDDETKMSGATAAGEILDKWFPGGPELADQWGPWAKLAFAGAWVLLLNFDFETLSLKPLRPAAREKKPTDAPAESPAADKGPDQPGPMSGGGQGNEH